MKRHFWFFVLVAIMTVVLFANAVSAGSEKVVILDATGITAGSVTTMEDALAKVNEGGTIQVVGTYEFADAEVLFAKCSGKVTVTGSDENARLHFVSSERVNVHFFSAFTFNDITWTYSHSSGKNMNIYAGPELTFGENMVFTCDSHDSLGTSCIAVRGGYMEEDCDTSVFTMESGTISFMNGSHEKNVENSYINILGSASLTARVQCGATLTGCHIGSSTVVINTTGSITEVDINGYSGSDMYGNSNVTITGGDIGRLLTARTGSTGLLRGDVTVTIGGNANVGRIELSEDLIDPEKTQTLIFQDDMVNAQVFSTGFGEGWDTVSVGKNNSITITGKATCSSLFVDTGAVVELKANTELPGELSGDGQVLLQKIAQEYVHEHKGQNFDISLLTDMDSLAGTGIQGTAVSGNYLFQADKYGEISVYDLSSDDPSKRVTSFKLASYNKGVDPNGISDSRWSNHTNQIMFGPSKFAEDDLFPLLYVTTGNSGDHDESGAYIVKCSIERIRKDAEGNWYTEIVQTIEFNDKDNIPLGEGDHINGPLVKMYQDGNGQFLYTSGNGYDASKGYEKIGWGFPAAHVDADPTDVTRGKFYIKSARFRTTESGAAASKEIYGIADYYTDSAYIITEFDLPALPTSESDPTYGKTVTLYPRDITDQFITPYYINFTQGGTMYQGRIYYSYGCMYADTTPDKSNEYLRNGIQIIDIAERRIVAHLDLKDTDTKYEEPECVAIWNGKLLLSTNLAKIYAFDMFMTDVDGVEATCIQTGCAAHTVCSYCGKLYSTDYLTELTDVTVPIAAHSLEKMTEKTATEQEAGNVEHWKCAACGKLFAEEDGKTELTEDAVRVPYVSEKKNYVTVIIGIVAAAAAVLAAVTILAVKRRKK